MSSLDSIVDYRVAPLSALSQNATRHEVFAALGLLALAYVFYQRYLSPLAKVPGPFLASFTNIWWVYIVLKRQQHLESISLHERYGPLVRIGVNHVMVADPQAFRTIYGAGNKYIKSDFYRPFKAKLRWSLTAECDERVHSKNRRLVSRAYSMDSVKRLDIYVDKVIAQFLNCIQGVLDQPVDLGEWLERFAYDSITEVTWSKSFGHLQKGDQLGLSALSKVIFGSGAWVGVIPWLYRIHHVISPVTGVWLGVTRRSIKLRALAAQKVMEHATQSENHGDILSYLQEVRRQKPNEYSEYDMVSTLTSNIFAGAESAAIALRAMVYYLLASPYHHEKFVQELRERRTNGLISDPITLEEAEAWPFLQAVMFEALRLHPPFAVHLPRVVPATGMVANDIFLPPGTIVGTNAWVIHRNKQAFGEDVEVFRPERWMDSSRKGEMQRYFFAFGGGTRTCLGRNVVWLEMSKLLPSLFTHVDLKLVNSNKPMPTKNIFLAFQQGPNVVMHKH